MYHQRVKVLGKGVHATMYKVNAKAGVIVHTGVHVSSTRRERMDVLSVDFEVYMTCLILSRMLHESVCHGQTPSSRENLTEQVLPSSLLPWQPGSRYG